ncbi:MAG: hypothetical protein HWN68_18440 [Desulfobacterales bacterium]|nr:hypothetical protein [Desulfobacterales bacterium]
MATKYQYYDTGDDSYFPCFGSNYKCQTFTTVYAHEITSVKLLVQRVGDPIGNFYVKIRATDGAGKPTGGDLAVVSVTMLSHSTSKVWREYEFPTPANLAAATKYAIVFYGELNNVDKCVRVWLDQSSPTYEGGEAGQSWDGGSTWGMLPTQDVLFEEWGNPIIELPTVQTLDADNVKYNQATLHGKLTDDGGEACEVRFNYGHTVAYGDNTDWQTGKVTNDLFQATITDLDPESTYHFRAEAKNSKGTCYGGDKEFDTPEVPIPADYRKTVSINHPALKSVTVYKDGVPTFKLEQLSNLDESRIENYVRFPVEPGVVVEVTTLAEQVYLFPVS